MNRNPTCSTPYGIRGLAQTHRMAAHGAPCVLNALRHQRFGTGKRCRWWTHATDKCSTPYGIRGLALEQGKRKRRSHYRAQRLTASEVWHWAINTGRLLFTLCSTPYGIRGLAHPCYQVNDQNIGRCSTPYGIRGLAHQSLHALVVLLAGAQRLTASEVWHLG